MSYRTQTPALPGTCVRGKCAAGRLAPLFVAVSHPYSLSRRAERSSCRACRDIRCPGVRGITVRAANNGGISEAILWTPVRDGSEATA